MTSSNDATSTSDSAKRALLDDLKARQIAFLQARLTSPTAEDEWKKSFAAMYAELLATPVGRLVDARALADATDAALSDDAVKTAIRPVARVALKAVVAELRESRARAGDYLPDAALTNVDALLERPKLFPERLMREVLEQDAIEEVMRDVLYVTLKEFSEKVNPFFADWGLPAILGKLAPFGFGGVKKGLESMRAEFDRRLEPEMRKFLQGFTKRGLHQMAETMIAKSDEPKAIVARKRIAAWILEQEVRELLQPLDAEGARLVQEIGLDVTAHTLSLKAVRERRRALLLSIIKEREAMPLSEVLSEVGVTHTPDLNVFARATWPLVRAALSTEAARSWIASIIGEFYEDVARSP